MDSIVSCNAVAMTAEPNSDSDSSSKDHCSLSHVLYEFQMFVLTKKKLSEEQTDPVIANALLESFRLHYRNILAFFVENNCPKQTPASSKDNITANSLRETPTSYYQSSYLDRSKVFDDICKTTLHVSFQRCTDVIRMQNDIYDNTVFVETLALMKQYVLDLQNQSSSLLLDLRPEIKNEAQRSDIQEGLSSFLQLIG